MEGRREAILADLKARGELSLADIAAHLDVSKQGALRHLETLVELGLVERTSAPHDGPGRPGHSYKLTAAAAERFPDRHRQLAGELVRFMNAAELETFFAQRAERLESELAEQLAGAGTLREKAARLVEAGRASGHMSELVDLGDGSYAVRHCNCPIAGAATATGHACHHEQEMYGRLTGGEVSRTSWLANGDIACTYEIKPTDSRTKKEGEAHR